jgi:large subunit ribosomal protein L23
MNRERLLKVILSPHVSEKSTIGMEKRNEYVFQVIDCATKPEIKDAVEFLFNTKVKSVRVLNVKPKTRLFRGVEGKKKGWKKAYVTLQADQKLDVMGAQ